MFDLFVQNGIKMGSKKHDFSKYAFSRNRRAQKGAVATLVITMIITMVITIVALQNGLTQLIPPPPLLWPHQKKGKPTVTTYFYQSEG